MPVTALIGTTSYKLLNAQLPKIQDALDQRAPLDFKVYDALGTSHFQPGQPVTITDSVAGQLYSGYINDCTESNYYPNAALSHTLSCFDQHYLADKRVASGLTDDDNMSNQNAGENVVYLLANYLSAEGVTASYAQRRDSTQSDFQVGTLTGTIAAESIGDGDLELATAGSSVSKSEATTSDFAAGTLSGMDAQNNQLNLHAYNALKMAGTNQGNLGDTSVYWQVWSGSSTVASGDTLNYDVWISSTSPEIKAGIDLVFSDGTRLKDNVSVQDQWGILAQPQTDLNGFANDQWYSRTINIGGFSTKVIVAVLMAFEGQSAGNYTAYFKNINRKNSGGTIQTNFYDGTANPYHPGAVSLSANGLISNNGYFNLGVTQVTAYTQSGSRISPSISLDPVQLVRGSIISWTSLIPAGVTPTTQTGSTPVIPQGTSLTILTSIDNQATWQPCSFKQAVPSLLPGFNVAARVLYTQVQMAITGTSPEVSPAISNLTTTVSSSWQQQKTDSITTCYSASDFNTGTYSNTQPNGASGLAIIGAQQSWDVDMHGQTTFGGNQPTAQLLRHQFQLGSNGNTQDALSRFDSGYWGNFRDMNYQVSVLLPNLTPAPQSGVVYRQTSWANGLYSFAYSVVFDDTHIELGYGTNGGAATYHLLSSFSFPAAIPKGVFYTLKVVVWNSGGTNVTHQIYLNNVLVINYTESTGAYQSAGQIGLRTFYTTSATYQVLFDSMGVESNPTGTWNNGSGISVNAVGFVGNSLIQWNATVPTGGNLLCETSVNGGTSWTAATNGGQIAGLLPGNPAQGVHLQVRFTLTNADPAHVVILQGWTAWLTTQTNASGSRVGPALNLSNVGRAGSALVTWNGVVPANCSLAVDTSLDNNSWTNIGSGTTGSAAVAGIDTQLPPVDDTFESNTSSFYTSTFQTNGSAATWNFSTAVPGTSYISASGGATAFLLYSSLSVDDVDLVTDMGTSDAGGLVWRFVDSNNFYDLVVADASSPTPNTVTLSKVANGSRSTLATASIAWTRTAPKRIRMLMLGATITVVFDGVQLLSYTDNFPLAAGQCGLRTDTVSGASSAIFYHLYMQAQGDDVSGGTFVFTRVRLVSTDPTSTPQLTDITTSVRNPNIADGAFIPSTTYSVLNGSTNTIAQDFDDMAKQSNYWWKIGYDPDTGRDKEMFFLPHNGKLAPFLITDADMLVGYGPVTVKRAQDLYRTVPWILGGTDTALQPPQSFKTDGFTQTFTLDYPVDSIQYISDGSKSYTFGVQGVDTGMDFYYTQGQKPIAQDASEVPLPPGLTLSVTYVGQINAVANAQNAAQIAAQAALEGTSGIIEVAETAPGLTKDGASQLAASRLATYGVTTTDVTFPTARVGLQVGQLLSIFLPQHGLVDFEVLITAMTVDWRLDSYRNPTGGQTDATPYFTVTATNGYLSNMWAATLSGLGR